jgi:hypothetical protein
MILRGYTSYIHILVPDLMPVVTVPCVAPETPLSREGDRFRLDTSPHRPYPLVT